MKKQDVEAARNATVKLLFDPATSGEKIFDAWKVLSNEPAVDNRAEPVEGFSSIKETCKFIGLSRATLWRHCKDGKFSSYAVGRRKVFKLTEVSKAVEGKNGNT